MHKTITTLLLGALLSTAFGSAIEFSGSASVDADWVLSRNGAELDREPFAWNFSIRPTLTMWGMPLNLNFLLSSYDVDFRQPFDRFKFGIPALVLPALPDLKLNIPWLEVALLDARPSYSDYSISGINVRGGAIDLKPGWFRLSAAAGQVQRGVIGSDSTDVAYRRWLYAGRVGVGKEEKSHLHLHFVKAWDDSASIPNYLGIVTEGAQTDTVILETPIENSVASLEGKLSFLDDKLSFEGELAGAAYNRDSRAAEIEIDQLSWLPSVVFQPRWTTQTDWAAKAGTELSLGNTQIGFDFEQIGWGFKSVGISSTARDTRTWSASFSQMFINPFTIMFDVSADVARDNLDGMEFVTTRTQSGFIFLGLFPQKAPSLNLTYIPMTDKAPAYEDGSEVDRITHIVMGSSGYNFNLGERLQGLNLTLTLTKVEDRINSDDESFNVDARGSVTHELLEILTLSWNAGATSTLGAGTGTSHIYSGGLGYNLSLWEKRWRTLFDANFQTTVNQPEDKLIARLKSTVEVFKSFNVSLTGQFTTYHGRNAEDDYSEFLGKAGVSYKW